MKYFSGLESFNISRYIDVLSNEAELDMATNNFTPLGTFIFSIESIKIARLAHLLNVGMAIVMFIIFSNK
jgi:hypothetical protein